VVSDKVGFLSNYVTRAIQFKENVLYLRRLIINRLMYNMERDIKLNELLLDMYDTDEGIRIVINTENADEQMTISLKPLILQYRLIYNVVVQSIQVVVMRDGQERVGTSKLGGARFVDFVLKISENYTEKEFNRAIDDAWHEIRENIPN